MIELLFLFGVIVLGIGLVASLIVGVLKLVFALVLLPFKVAIGLTKGVVGMLIGIPLLVVFLLAVTNVVPILLFALLLPVILFVVGVVGLLKLII